MKIKFFKPTLTKLKEKQISNNLNPETIALEKEITYFIKTLKLNKINLNLFLHNLKSLKIKNTNDLEIENDFIEAYYDLIDNEITILNFENPHVIFHELFHTSSTKKQEDLINSGFSTIKIDQNNQFKSGVGFYLNELYTEYLTQKFFGKDNDCLYNMDIPIIQRFEQIFGEKQLYNHYFQSPGIFLPEQITSASEKKDYIEFVNNLDLLEDKKMIYAETYETNP
ncbi:MAG: hypothetical protein IJ093_02665, partial [Bacilli bacterium]|nr:hypothetical protein [Bacilli bacterium]